MSFVFKSFANIKSVFICVHLCPDIKFLSAALPHCVILGYLFLFRAGPGGSDIFQGIRRQRTSLHILDRFFELVKAGNPD